MNPFQEAIETRRLSREKWRGINTQMLIEEGIAFTSLTGEVLEIREHDGLSVDFFVCERRWLHEDTGKLYRGSNKMFQQWYKTMKEKLGKGSEQKDLE